MNRHIDYTYINARIHGLISRLLTDEDFRHMERVGSVTEVLHLLREGPYRKLTEIYNSTGDIKMVERELLQYHRESFRNLEKHSPEGLKPVIRAFAGKLDIQILKMSIRLWFDQNIRKRSISEFIEYIPEDITWNGITPYQIINAASAEELKTLLQQAGLAGPEGLIPQLSEELDEVVKTERLFFLELAVDKARWMKLLKSVNRLSRSDRKILKTLLGEHIDALNITRLLRYPSLVSRIPADWPWPRVERRVERIIIPGGKQLSLQDLMDAVQRGWKTGKVGRSGGRRGRQTTQSDSSETARRKSSYDDAEGDAVIDAGSEVISLINRKHSAEMDEGSLSETGSGRRDGRMEVLGRMQRHLNAYIMDSTKRFKRGDPFTIGTAAAYILMKEQEIDRLQSVINAKYYGLKRESGGGGISSDGSGSISRSRSRRGSRRGLKENKEGNWS